MWGGISIYGFINHQETEVQHMYTHLYSHIYSKKYYVNSTHTPFIYRRRRRCTYMRCVVVSVNGMCTLHDAGRLSCRLRL